MRFVKEPPDDMESASRMKGGNMASEEGERSEKEI